MGAAERSTGTAAVAGANCAAAYLAMACFAVEGGSFNKVYVASCSLFLSTFLIVHVAFIWAFEKLNNPTNLITHLYIFLLWDFGNMFFFKIFLHDAKVTTIPCWYADLWARPSFRTQVLARIEILNAYITQLHSQTQFSHDFPNLWTGVVEHQGIWQLQTRQLLRHLDRCGAHSTSSQKNPSRFEFGLVSWILALFLWVMAEYGIWTHSELRCCHCFCVSLTQGPRAWFRKSTAERESKPDSMRGASSSKLSPRKKLIIPENTRIAGPNINDAEWWWMMVQCDTWWYIMILYCTLYIADPNNKYVYTYCIMVNPAKGVLQTPLATKILKE